jgi:DNA helicase-2/ATP-dependent DNA helicase PcrA
MKVSYSKLSTFKECPFKYKCLYIDGLWHLKKDRPYLSMGSSVHLALRDFFTIRDKGQRTLQNLGKLLKKNWIRKGYKDDKEEKEYAVRAWDMLSRFYETYDPYILPLIVEKNFFAKVEENLIFSVRIDRVDRLPSGGYELIDYKTGKNTDIGKEEEDLQLTIYYLALQSRYRIRPTRFTYYFLEDNKRVTTSQTEKQIEQGLISIKNLVRNISTTHEFLPTPNPFCSFCDFAEMCPARKRKNEDEK